MLESAFQVWLHPRRAFELLEELRLESAVLRGEQEQENVRLAELSAGLSESRRVQDDLERVHRDLESEVEELKRVNAEQAQRLKEWEEAGAEMERVASQLEKMVDLRERMNRMRLEYEAKIDKLERQLWAGRGGGPQYARKSEEIPDPSESELLEPGESPFSSPSPEPINMRPASPRERILPKDDDTDWLLPLPTDL